MRINNNIMALNTHRQLGINNTNTSKSLEKLSSGYRINRAGDDAAGLAISEKMRAQIRGLNMASKNAQDGISLIQTAEGALTETHAILQRMRELAVQASTDTNTLEDRREIQKEINQLLTEVDRIATDTEFNTKKLLNGELSGVAGSGGPGAGKAASGSEEVGGTEVTITAGNVGENFNDIEIKFVGGAASDETAEWDSGVLTVTLKDSENYTQAQISGFISSATGDAPEGLGGLTVAFDGNIASGADLDVTITLADGEDATNPVDPPEDGENNAAVIHIGANSKQNLQISISSMKTTDLGGIKGLAEKDVDDDPDARIDDLRIADDLVDEATTGGVLTQEGADIAVTNINTAITQVSSERSKLGALQNRLEHTIKNLDTSSENLAAAESRIRDVDMAKEMMEFTKQNILMQAATAMLAQANMAPQTVLKLLG